MRLRKIIDDHLTMNRRSRTEWSEEVGMSKQTGGRWLNGRADLSGQNFKALLLWLLEEETETEGEGD